MRIVPILAVSLLLLPGRGSGQEVSDVDSLRVSFWSAVHQTASHAQECVGDVLEGGPPRGSDCSNARSELERSFILLARLDVCCSDSTFFALGDSGNTLRTLMLAGGGLVYLVAEAERLRGSSDQRRKIEIASALVARKFLAEQRLEELDRPLSPPFL